MSLMKAPFPYFGGKSTVAPLVWDALGEVQSYIEPFFGSGAVLLNRPSWHNCDNEIINDKDGFVSNVWRALQSAPDEVAMHCDKPVNHADLNAIRKYLIAEEDNLLQKLEMDADWYDAKAAGRWIWSASCWIGSGLTKKSTRPHLTDNKGVNILTKIPHLTDNKGVQEPYSPGIYDWFRLLSERLRFVKVVCGDWNRVCGGNWQNGHGTVGIFFDPPYAAEQRGSVYHHDSYEVAMDVEKWCLGRGASQDYRIVCAGYEGEYPLLGNAGWSKIEWSTRGGYSNNGAKKNENRHLERLWMSPHCLRSKQLDLFSSST